MKDIEKVMTDMVCDYVTDRIRKNMRVNLMLTDEEAERIDNLTMKKCLKDLLNDMAKLIPDNIFVQMKGVK